MNGLALLRTATSAVVLLPVPWLAAAVMPTRIDDLVAASPAIQRGHWGAYFVHLPSGRVLFARNERSLFTPASNTKLYSTALALSRLGPDHVFRTRLVSTRPPDAEGTVEGDLILFGGGDPTLSGRPLPYDHKAPFGDPLAALDALVSQAVRAGLRRVTGSVIGDDTRYVWEPYPEGWTQDDTVYDYGAPVSALILHDNAFRVVIDPGPAAGSPASVIVAPQLPWFTFDCRVRTAARPPAKVDVRRDPGSRLVSIRGSVALRQATRADVAVDDPALYAAFALRESLRRHGVVADGDIAARHRQPDEVPASGPEGLHLLATRTSPPLSQTLQVIDKVSHNLQAEIALRETALARGREPSRQGGLEELRDFLASLGAGRDEYRFEDGSGLSRLTLASPSMTVGLLRALYASPHRDVWLGLMPVGGEDGTLSFRFKTKGKGEIFAKTGTLSNTGSLSGYARVPQGGMVAFSVMVNNVNAPAGAIREFIDKLVLLILEM